MQSDADSFREFAKLRLRVAAFDAVPDRDDTGLFYDQLNSAKTAFAWTRGAVNPKGETFAAVLGYVDVYTPNAFADRFDGRYFLGMHSALYAAINEFTMFCFAQRSFFPEVGDPALEQSPRPMDGVSPGIWLLSHTRKGGRVEPRHSEALTVRCDRRRNMSIYLAFLMSRFVWLHELAHAFNGHVSLVQDKGIALRLTEISDPRYAIAVDRELSEEDMAVLRALELDADQSALWGSFRIQTDRLENVEGIADLPEPLRLKLTLFAGYAMTWLFEEFQAYLEVDDPRSHPAPQTRLVNLLDLASSRLVDLHADFSTLNTFACAEFDAICDAIPRIFRPTELSVRLKSDKSRLERLELERELLKLREVLGDFAFSQKKA